MERLVWVEANLRAAQVKAGCSQPAVANPPARTRQAIRTTKAMFRKDGLLYFNGRNASQ